MRVHFVFMLAIVSAVACGSQPAGRTYTLQGQVQSIQAPQKQVTVKHEDIKGLMPAMTMPYNVRDEKLIADLKPGDLINATLIVESNDAYLQAIKKVGEAPLEKPPVDQSIGPTAR